MSQTEAERKKSLVKWRKTQKSYHKEFDKIMDELPDLEDRKRFDLLYRSLFIRIRTSAEAVKRLYVVSTRLQDPELSELWSDLADGINNAWSILQSKNALMKKFHGQV